MKQSGATQKLFRVAHASDISSARRWATQLAASLGFDDVTAGRLAIIVTEAATNILKHAVNGMLLIAPINKVSGAGIEVLALDRGPGIHNLAHSCHDGISTAGTAGTGLGAMKRQSDSFDIYSAPGKGTAIHMCIHAHPQPLSRRALQVGAICVPIAGEEECGDAWAIAANGDSAALLVADGLGHGPDAAIASNAAVKTLELHPNRSPELLLEAMHQALRPTRGAAAAVMRLEFAGQIVNFAGIGNIAACVVTDSGQKQLVSHNGIVGNNMRKIQQFALPWPEESVVVMCSDGIGTQWNLNKYPGLFSCHSALIAGVIYRDFARERDDATVVAVRLR